MKEKIISLSKSLDIDIIGFTKLENYNELEKFYLRQKEKDYKCSFQVGSIYDKCHLKEKYSEYNSVIVIGVAYNNSIGLEDKVHLSSFCFGKDYHLVLSDKLNNIGALLEKEGYSFKIFVDNNELDERYIAYKAGLGFYGKNHLLINEKIGSNFFIGVIFTDCIFDYDKEENKSCLNCGLCVDSCPTKVLGEDLINCNKCLSYITQKKNLSEEDKKILNNCVYGCDVCSNVCPYNRDKTSVKFVLDDKSILQNYDEINEEDWHKIYKETACYWRGREILNRNIKELQEKLEKE